MNTIIVAMDEYRVIGNKGKLPWHIPEDLKEFKKRTLGHQIIMGKNTWNSLPVKPLPGRRSLVVSTSMSQLNNDCVHTSLESALKTAEIHHPGEEVFIIGGASFNKYALEKGLVDNIVASIIPGEHEGDVFFPELGEEWKVTEVKKRDGFAIWEYAK